MKKNISTLHDCYGCGVCIKACPVKIIHLRENQNGFYAPVIDEQDKCIECGLCLKICAFNHNKIAAETTGNISFAAWSNDENTRNWCSSGGIGFEIGRKLIEEGYEAVGVRFDSEKNRAEHYIASTVEDFMPSVGSKYIPSYTAEALLAIDRHKKYLVTGTPCQIDSFRRYIQHFKVEDNFILLDFFCHGVPSLLLWNKYTSELTQKIGKITFASWRNKSTGWQDSWSMNADATTGGESINWHDSYNLKIREKKHFYTSRKSQGDLFYRFFLGNFCLNQCCYTTCKYKMLSSSADIRIGDFWGKRYETNNQGVSIAIAFTQRGKALLETLNSSCTLIPEPTDIATEGQMHKNAYRPLSRDKVIKALRTSLSLKQIYWTVIFPYRIIGKIYKTLNKIKS